jgi:uncharacterized repeat protein (TIGR02543 family)
MKRKYFIAILAALALFSACKNPAENTLPPALNETYTVTFDKNHQDAAGYTEADPKIKTVTTPATTVGALPIAPIRTGYTFTGWNTAVNGSGAAFTEMTTVNNNITVYAQWQNDASKIFTISFNISGNVSGDSVAASPTSGEAGAAITISYTLANDKLNNRLNFSGTTAPIQQANGHGSGSRSYTVNADDANENRVIAINAIFSHSDLELDSIAFANDNANVNKTYGDVSFPWAVTNSGAGTGAIIYSSGNTGVATVNNSGEVTILKAGDTTITAAKASDGTYAGTTAQYNLIIEKLQLTISGTLVTQTKSYNGNTTAAVTNVGTLGGVINGDSVTVSATAAYNSANVAEANKITVTYAISGADAGNYTRPDNFEITNGVSITKAASGTVTAPTLYDKAHNWIMVNPVSAPSNGQDVEYAISTGTTAPSSGWQSSPTFTGLTPNTTYYVFARAKGDANYNQGTEQISAAITTDAAAAITPVQIVDFETDALGATTKYTFTRGDNDPTVTIVADPVNPSGKSLKIVTNGATDKTFNQAAVIPINLPYELQEYKNFTFRFNYTSGNLSEQSINVYAAKNTSAFVRYGFGNPANHQNQSQQFAANLVGSVTPSYSPTNQWQSLTITITNPGSAISNLTGDIFLAVGINHNSSITYLLDDITFNIKDGFEPPPPPPPKPSAPTPPATGAVFSGTYRNLFKEFGKTDAEIDAKVQAAWNQLFVSTDDTRRIYYPVGNDMAYILDSGNNDVRSEGMSYGMMMAVQMNDQDKFDKLWKWAHTYMYNDRTVKTDDVRGYFSWQCNINGTKKDRGPAPDGEFYFVTALLFASTRWGDGSGINEYGRKARHILYDMIHRDEGGLDNWQCHSMFNTSNHLPVFSTMGNSASHTDPSYILPAFYDIWAIEIENGTQYHNIWPNGSAGAAVDAQFYRDAATAGREFFHTTVNTTTGLGPDYANFDGTPTGGQHADFRNDAWRIALNIGMDYAWWANDPWQITQSDRIQTFFHSKGVDSYGALWTLPGVLLNDKDAGAHSPGLVACNAVASLVASQALTWDFIEDFWNISTTTGQWRYYDGCLYMMGLLHVSGKFKAYLSNGGTPPPPSSNITPTTATFDKNTDGANYRDIAVTMTLNGNTLSSISGGSPAITTGNYIVSGSAVTIKKEYLAQQSNGATTLTFNFSAGSARTIVITIGDTTGGGPIGDTKLEYIFDADVNATFAPSGSTSSAVRKVNNGANVLEVTIQAKDDVVILPFNLGSTTLANYTSLYVEVAPISGDSTYKSFVAQVSLTGTFGKGDSSNNTTIARQDNNALGGYNSWGTYTIPLQNKTSPSLTGAINIAFWLPNANPGTVYQKRVLRLIP